MMEKNRETISMPENRKIIFLLPGVDRNFKTGEPIPTGGFKVVYQYANMFARDGYDVELAFAYARCRYTNPLRYPFSFLTYWYRKALNRLTPGAWFQFEKNVARKVYYRFSSPWFVPSENAVMVATGFETSGELRDIKSVPVGQKAYFVQGYETWAGSAEAVDRSFTFGFRNITIAPWIGDRISRCGAKYELVTNGFDFEVFGLLRPIESRSKYEVLMLNHLSETKRCKDSMVAIIKAHERYPQIHLSIFGTCDAPADMPEWCTYHRNPSEDELVRLYNDASIYVAASVSEGFGLTVGEAMICGCAVACTNNGGFTCMAKDDDTALLSEVYDVDALASNVTRLIDDDALRHRIAVSGNRYIQQFRWEKSYGKFKSIVDSMMP